MIMMIIIHTMIMMIKNCTRTMSWKSWSLPLGKAETSKFCHLLDIIIIVIVVNLGNIVMKIIISSLTLVQVPQNYTSINSTRSIYSLDTLTIHAFSIKQP